MTNKIQVGIVGGAGYTAGELLRILLRHPQVQIAFIHSQSNAGQPVSNVHTDLEGETDLLFTNLDFTRTDVVFLCSGHGQSVRFLQENNVPERVKIIDLSTDFRAANPSHDFVYGLPEVSRNQIAESMHVANPGCFATSIQLALLPLVFNNLLTDEIHIHAITGSTGAGFKPEATTHFSWRNNNVSVYKAFEHQHLQEIGQTVSSLQPAYDKFINFVPLRGNFSRGILASVYTHCSADQDTLIQLYTDYYETHPFVHISAKQPDIKQVVNTNKCLLHIEKHGSKVHIVSVIDNLTKGASGQAVQNMNLMFNLPETEGLLLKPIAF